MNCSQVREQLPLMVYGDLSAADVGNIERHLVECPVCLNQLVGLRQVREALDATPTPEVFVNPGQVFLSAAVQPAAKPWRRWAITSVLAASLALLAFLNLEMRVNAQQMVVRWGRSIETGHESKPVAIVDQTKALTALEDRVRVLQELTHALARDVDVRDRARSDDWVRTKSQLEALSQTTGQRLFEAKRDVDALYTAHFKFSDEGAKP